MQLEKGDKGANAEIISADLEKMEITIKFHVKKHDTLEMIDDAIKCHFDTFRARVYGGYWFTWRSLAINSEDEQP